MKKLLFVNSSLAGADSRSAAVARELIAALQARHGKLNIVERDVSAGAVPHLSGEHLAAQATPPVHRSARQHALAQSGDALLAEVEAAEVIVIAAPMYNFTIPSTLHAWLDHITRAGRTFRYTAEGKPEGLLKNKKVYVVAARGGVYTADSPAKAMDFQEPYLRAMLGFNGLTDITFVHVEGQRISPAAAEAGLRRAREAVHQLVPTAVAA
jgi:FMN-dependent NADH-azoreductase